MLEGYAEPEDMARERESSERPRRFVATRIESYISIVQEWMQSRELFGKWLSGQMG